MSAERIGMCFITGPAGQRIQVPYELWEAMMSFIEAKKSGLLTVEYSKGGISLIDSNIRTRFKGSETR